VHKPAEFDVFTGEGIAKSTLFPGSLLYVMYCNNTNCVKTMVIGVKILYVKIMVCGLAKTP